MRRTASWFGAFLAVPFLLIPACIAAPEQPMLATAKAAAPNYWKTKYAPNQLKVAAQSLNSDYLGETNEHSRWKQDRIKIHLNFSPARSLCDFNKELYTLKVQQSLESWNDALDEKFHFEITTKPEDADVEVSFDTDRHHQADITAGYTIVKYADRQTRKCIDGADVTILLLNAKGIRYNDYVMDMVIHHEFGHVLGLRHSVRSEDIMHPIGQVSSLSPRDRNSIRKLYGLSAVAPDITNCL